MAARASNGQYLTANRFQASEVCPAPRHHDFLDEAWTLAERGRQLEQQQQNVIGLSYVSRLDAVHSTEGCMAYVRR